MKWIMKKKQKKRRKISFFWVVINFTLNMAWLWFWVAVGDLDIEYSDEDYNFLRRFTYFAILFAAPAHAIYWIWMQWRCYRQWKYYKKYPTLEAEGKDAGNAEIDNE